LWLMGSDQFAVLESWYRGLELISLAHIVVFTRPAHGQNEVLNERMRNFFQLHNTQSVQRLASSPAGKLYFSDQEMLDVSSTQIRESLKQGTSVQHQLPESVLSYIMENQLYQTGVSE
jgi:nicotinate-nucleotide adenylyltransferase